MPEFSRHTLEVLREPIEAGEVSISRAAYQLRFPSRFQLVAAMNPCPCGELGDQTSAADETNETYSGTLNSIEISKLYRTFTGSTFGGITVLKDHVVLEFTNQEFQPRIMVDPEFTHRIEFSFDD